MPKKLTTFQCSQGHVRSRADIRAAQGDQAARRHQGFYCVHCGEECDRRPPQVLRDAFDLDELGVYTTTQYQALLERQEALVEADKRGLPVEDVLDEHAEADQAREMEIQAKVDADEEQEQELRDKLAALLEAISRMSDAEFAARLNGSSAEQEQANDDLFTDPWPWP